MDIITWQSCVPVVPVGRTNATLSLIDNKCANKEEKGQCIRNGGTCRIDVDGYYIEVLLSVIYGILWYQWGKRVLNYLQDVPRHEWHVLSKPPPKDEDGISLSEIHYANKNLNNSSLN